MITGIVVELITSSLCKVQIVWSFLFVWNMFFSKVYFFQFIKLIHILGYVSNR